MKIDREKINALSALPDAELWREIKKMSGSYGINLPDDAPSHDELQRLRSLFFDTEKINLFGAMKIINNYKKGAK